MTRRNTRWFLCLETPSPTVRAVKREARREQQPGDRHSLKMDLSRRIVTLNFGSAVSVILGL